MQNDEDVFILCYISDIGNH